MSYSCTQHVVVVGWGKELMKDESFDSRANILVLDPVLLRLLSPDHPAISSREPSGDAGRRRLRVSDNCSLVWRRSKTEVIGLEYDGTFVAGKGSSS
jgi:hypothetical protein